MMLNSRFELSKIERENRECKENFVLTLSKIESRKRNGNYQIFEIEREISLSTLDFSLESQCLVSTVKLPFLTFLEGLMKVELMETNPQILFKNLSLNGPSSALGKYLHSLRFQIAFIAGLAWHLN